MHWEESFESVAATHEGLVAKFHLAELACNSDHWWRAIRTGRWLPVGARLIRAAAAPASEGQRVLAGVLDASPGAALHGPSALAWLGVRGFDLSTVHIARARGVSGTRASLAQLHEIRALRAHHLTVVRGVVTETALRAVWAEAERFGPEPLHEIGLARIGRLLDQTHRLGLVTWAGLHEMVDDIHERGRAGSAIMRELARQRPRGSSPTESRLEDQFEKVLANAGVRLLRRQRVLGGHEPIGRCDFSDDELPLATEVNSLTFHTTPTDQAADERRYVSLMDAGFTVCVIWEDDLWTRTQSVVSTVAEARRRAARGDRGVLHSPGCPWPHPRVGERKP